jgi:hypothetical protein
VQQNIPDGYFCEDHMIWGDPGSGSIFSRIYDIQFPDLSASDDDTLIALQSDLRLMLGCMQSGERAQLSYYTGNHFSGPLDRFEAETEKSKIEICSRVRDELVSRFRARMKAETLIQANARLALSTRMPRFVKEEGKRVKGFADVFKILKRSFDQRERFFDLLLRSYGGEVKGLGDQGHYDELVRFWSPGQSRQPVPLR